MYKRIIINDIQTDYLIYDDGRVFSEKVNRFLTPDKSTGYCRVLLTVKGKGYRKNVHGLVAEYFIPNPNNLEIVHHIDGDTYNNNFTNLQWVTFSENSLPKNKHSREKILHCDFSKEELEKEEWKIFRQTSYAFSNLGRMKNLNTNKIVKGHINPKYKYIRDTLCLENGKRLTLPRHRLVYESFHPTEEIIVINHIDGVRYNNKLSNLENVTIKENLEKAYYETKTRRTRSLIAVKENFKQVFYSIASAANFLKLNEATIRGAMNRKGTFYGYTPYEITSVEYQKLIEGSETIESIIEKKNLNE